MDANNVFQKQNSNSTNELANNICICFVTNVAVHSSTVWLGDIIVLTSNRDLFEMCFLLQ